MTNIFEDYYDALDYDSKRQKGPRTPGERTPGAQKRGSFSGRGSLGSAQVSRGPNPLALPQASEAGTCVCLGASYNSTLKAYDYQVLPGTEGKKSDWLFIL